MKYYNKLNGKYYSTLGGMARTFRKLGYTPKQYYDKFMKISGEGICKNCLQQTKYKKFSYNKFCSTKCAGEYNKNSSKIYDSNYRTEEEIANTKSKISKNWHMNHPDDSWLIKRRKTIEEKFNCTNSEFMRAKIQNFHDSMNEKEKVKFFDKATSANRRKNLKFKNYELNGETILVQGYEPIVLDILKRYGFETSIKAGRNDIGFIRYNDINGKNRRYFPDIVLNNFLIEVKSPYTLSTDVNIINKLHFAKQNGYIPILFVLDKNQIEMCEKDLIETISSQAPNWYRGRFNDYPFIGVGYKQMITEVLGN